MSIKIPTSLFLKLYMDIPKLMWKNNQAGRAKKKKERNSKGEGGNTLPYHTLKHNTALIIK